MLRLMDEWSSKPRVTAFVFHLTVVLSRLCGGQHQVVCPSQPIVAAVGDDIMLQCHVEPAVDATFQTVEWTRPDLKPRFVHLWRDGVELITYKHPSYAGRTSLSFDKLKHGDISLILYDIKLCDEGTYRCYIPTLNVMSSVELVVGATSSLIISLMRTDEDGLVLQCKSEGWYPEPEVVWLDAEGNLLPAGPTETTRGPGDLYTVSSRVTVEKRHSSSFTCRVHQKNINQTRETHLHVPDDYVNASSSCTAHITISLAVVLMLILAVVLVVWKVRQKHGDNFDDLPKKTSGSDPTELQVLTEDVADITRIKDLDEKQANLDGELKKVEEECKFVVKVVNLLMDHKSNVEDRVTALTVQLNEIQATNNTKHPKNKLHKKGCRETKTDLGTEEEEFTKKLQDAEMTLKSILCGVGIETEKKKVLDRLKEQIHQQLEEIKEQRDEIQRKLQTNHSDVMTALHC